MGGVSPGELLRLGGLHLGLVVVSVLAAVALALPVAILVTRRGKEDYEVAAKSLANVGQTVPSIAVIGLAAGYVGIGAAPTLLALVVLALLPVLANSTAGLRGVPEDVKRAALGQGMSPWQILVRVELPLALPVILAGVRTATVVNVGSAALAAEIGAECLGNLIFQGISTNRIELILAGAIPTALLALACEEGLASLERSLLSPGIEREGASP